MLRLVFWWFCWWFTTVNTLLLAYRLHDPFHRGMVAIIAVWLLWVLSRGCGAALVGFCREDMRGARRWQARLGSPAIPSLFSARMHYALTFWLWWGIVIFGGITTLPMTVMEHRIIFSVGLVIALALATHIRGHAAVDLYRAAAMNAAARRVGAGD